MDAKKIREVAAELITLASECEAKAVTAATPPAGLLKGDWEHTGELREPRKLADGSYEPWMHQDGYVVTDFAACGCGKGHGFYTDARRWIVRPKAKQPVPTAADIPEGWQIDQGPMTWREACEKHDDSMVIFLARDGTWADRRAVAHHATWSPDDITYTLKPVAKPAPKVTPWELSPLHARKVVIRNDGAGWGMIVGVRDLQFIITGWGKVTPAELRRDWKWDVTGSPCGEVES